MKQKIAPLLYRPSSINNITHAIALLKIKQNKYKKYRFDGVVTGAEIYTRKSTQFNADEIMDGFMESKLVEKFEGYKTLVLESVEHEIQRRLKTRKSEVEMSNFKVNLRPGTEDSLFQSATVATFEDEFLFDCYEFLQQGKETKLFLQAAYEKFMLRYMKLNHNQKDTEDIKAIVTRFVRLKYSKSEFNISIYEDRYLWAELQCLVRLGRKNDALQLLAEFKPFFDLTNDNFGVAFTNFLHEKSCETRFVTTFSDDKFKIYLIGLMKNTVISDGGVVGSVEDYLYTLILCNKKLNADDYKNPKVKLMVYLFNKSFKKAAKLLLKEDFSLVSKFFILFELCGITNYDHFAEDSSSTASVRSYTSNQPKDTGTIHQIFLNFLFSIAQKLTKESNKIKLLESIQHNEQYSGYIPEFLVKYELYDLLQAPSLSRTIAQSAIEILKKTNKKKLLPLLKMLDEVTYASVMEEALEQAILTDEMLPQGVDLNHCEKVEFQPVLKKLIKFYRFNFDSTPENLNGLCIFDKDFDCRRFKLIIEHIFKNAVVVIRETSNREFARMIFKLCGALELNDECGALASKELVGLI